MSTYIPFDEEELARRADEAASAWFVRVFNNFLIKLPGSLVYEQALEDGGLCEQTIREWYVENCYDWRDGFENGCEASDRYLDTTGHGFFQDVGMACVRVGYSLDGVRGRVQIFRDTKINTIPETDLSDAQREEWQKFGEFLTPIYRELRMMGYNPHDIWG